MIRHVYDFLARSAARSPEKVAVVEGEVRLSYAQLDELSQRLASRILKILAEADGSAEGAATQRPVLIILPKGIPCLLGFLATVLSGNFYTLIDEKSPPGRIAAVVEVLKPALLITSEKLKINLALPTLLVEEFWQGKCDYEIDRPALDAARAGHIDTKLAYVLFTSGSTGVPKGVAVAHKSIIDYAFWVCETFGLGQDDALANQSPFYFDNSVLDIYASFKAGASLHILANSSYAFPARILDYLEREEITLIFWVPSVLVYFANTKALEGRSLPALRGVLFCGELMPNKQLNAWRAALPQATFANLYGPTEATDVCCYYVVDRPFADEELLPIGRACENTELLVFDEAGRLIRPEQVGVRGELYVRGCGLAAGYFADPARTAQAFVQNPLHQNYPDPLYKTGDIVAYNDFAELLCYGRADNQIKYMGHRIELGEIEAVLGAHEEVEGCVCVFEGEIVCFYVAKNELDLSPLLREKLPSYMHPKRFFREEKFALNDNGKIDRKILREKARK